MTLRHQASTITDLGSISTLPIGCCVVNLVVNRPLGDRCLRHNGNCAVGEDNLKVLCR
jgi:hypothetical protein